MKMINTIRLGCLTVIILFCSCVDDNGNYTYQEPDNVMPVEITGLSDTSFKMFSTVNLKPEITGMDDEKNYRFTWYTYPVSATGYVPARDTLATTRDLTFEMKYAAGEKQTLVFEVRDKRTDLFVNSKVTIVGVSNYSKGWFVLKDADDRTDIDFVMPDGTILENILLNDVGESFPGKAVKVAFQAFGYTHEQIEDDGTVTLLNNKKALYVLSTNDLVTLNPDQMKIYKRFNNQFYAAPETCLPQDISICNMDIYLMNAGLLHSIYGMSTNVGKFGFAKSDNVDLFPKLMPFSWGNSSCLLYSRDTRSFVTADVWSASTSNLLEPTDADPVKVSPTAMNADLIDWVVRGEEYSGTKVYALMKSISGPEEYYFADMLCNNVKYPFLDFDTIPSTRQLVHADVYAAHQVNSIYFAKGNVLSYYQKNASDADSYEKTNIYPFPENETITYIEQVESPYASKEPFNQLIVITNSPEGWKLYRFELEGEGTSPNILQGSTPVVYSGKGTARHAIYVE